MMVTDELNLKSYFYDMSAFLMSILVSVTVYFSVSVCCFRNDIWPDVESHQRSSIRPQKPTEWTSGTNFSLFLFVRIIPLFKCFSSNVIASPSLSDKCFQISIPFLCVITYILYHFLKAGGVFSNVLLVKGNCAASKVAFVPL